MKYLILPILLFVTACSSITKKDDIQIVTKTEYVVRTAPDTLKTLPPLPVPLQNPKTASNNDVATFINRTEIYVSDLESMIQTLVNFYEKPVTTSEAKSMEVVTPRSSATPTPNRIIQPQSTSE